LYFVYFMSIFIANWKMNPVTLQEAKQLFNLMEKKIKSKNTEIIICPPFIYLEPLSKLLQVTSYKPQAKLGAQDVFWEEKGAFTGEISVTMLKEIGCQYVIIGHSERRQYLKETDEMVNKKVKATLKKNLIPIICIGESLKQKQNNKRDFIIFNQINKALEGVSVKKNQKIIIAYEPIWAIGTGHSINSQEAEDSIKKIKYAIINLYSLNLVQNNFQIIYGGSVDSTNIKSFIDQSTIDGVLVGGASLKIDEVVKMIE